LDPPAVFRLLRVAGFLRAEPGVVAARRVFAVAPFFPDDFFCLADLVGGFFAVFFAAAFRLSGLFAATFRAFFGPAFFLTLFFGAAFFLVVFFFDTFFFKTFFFVDLLLAEAFLEAFFAPFFLAFFTTDLRRAELGRLVFALVFLVAAFFAGIILPPGPNLRNGRLYIDRSPAEASREQNR